MILNSNINDAFVAQLHQELGNYTKYLTIHNYFENLQLKGLSSYFLKQADEEKGHAEKFNKYINDRVGGIIIISEVDAPNLNLTDFASIGDSYLKIEQDTTESIESIFELALGEKSYMDLPFIQEMLALQVSEEDEAQEFALKIKMVKDIVLFDATFGD
jgi:ferritin